LARASGWAASALIYTVITAFLGRDVLAQLGSSIANDPGDPLLTAAVLHWNAHHLPWSDAWWQFPIFHPTRDTLAFSEHLLGVSVIAAPIAWITGNPLTAYNLTTLLTFPLCALAMYALVYYMTRSSAAAFLSGLAYGFAPYRMSNLPHIQMLASFWAPLSLLGLHGFLDAVSHTGPRGSPAREEGSGEAGRVPRRSALWWLAMAGACWALQAAANWYTLVLFSVLIGLWVLWFVIVPGRWRALAMIAAAAVVSSIPLAPIVYKYLTVHAFHGLERTVGEMRIYSADVAAVLCAPNLAFWGWLRVACRGEGELFPGVALFGVFVVALISTLRGGRFRGSSTHRPRVDRGLVFLSRALAAVAGAYGLVMLSVILAGPWQIDAGLVRVSASDIDKPLLIALAAGAIAVLLRLAMDARRRSPSIISFYLFAAIATWALALGPTLILMGEISGRPGPFALLQALPGVSGLRVPARFWLMTLICLSVVAGLVLAELIARARPQVRRALLAVAACALLADGWIVRIPARAAPLPVPDASALQGGIVLQLPIDPYPDMATTWRAVTGGWRSVNGYSGYLPSYYTTLSLAAKAGDEGMFAPFRRNGDLHVVVADDQPALKALVERQPGVTRTAQGHGSTQYRLPQVSERPAGEPGRGAAIRSAASACAAGQIALVLDGDPATRWDCSQSPDSYWLTIDLGAAVPITGVVYGLGPYTWNPPSQLEIATSVDGDRWMTARRGSILRELIEGGLADARSLHAVLRFPPQEARYLRIRPVDQPEEFVWWVSEIDVLTP
jgi:hypothetical protein